MRKGLLICFAGVDGSGKTTLARSLEDYLKKSGLLCKYVWCGWRGFESFLFGPFARLIKTHYERGGTFNRLTKTAPFSSFATFDYILRVFPSILVSLYRYDVVIADRYVYDLLVGLAVTSGKKNPHIQKLLNLLPKPDITFYIDISEELAYSRKNDISSPNYLSKQKKIYPKIFENYNTIVKIIEGTKNKEELLKIVLEEVKKCQRSLLSV